MKRIALTSVLLALCLVLLMTGCAKESDTDESLKYILDKGTFVLGLDDSFPPMGFRGEDGEITGFDIDLAREVCTRMGVELKLQPIDWDAKILDLNSGDIDVIWNGLTITEDRQEKINFSKPYIANKQIIIVQAASGIDLK
ncbi:MAG: transporter substrate-binding domain-containing protein, partial [Spirochaetia bacterium]|nr:transporter substrate-binding domain-containing protein [Spirochaetia bacterium]